MYDLYEKFAHRYDLHTPPDRFKRSHAYVLDQARRLAPGGRLLDVGCGTGAFLEKALAAGFDAYGTDASPAMIEIAVSRVGRERVRVERMQDLCESEAYDVICSLSWTIHYCDSETDLAEIVRRYAAALRPGGLLLLEAANSARMTGAVCVDREPGPKGEPDDTLFIHRFRPLDENAGAIADYIYVSKSLAELVVARHDLNCCNPELVENAMRLAGLTDARIVDRAFVSTFVRGVRRSGIQDS